MISFRSTSLFEQLRLSGSVIVLTAVAPKCAQALTVQDAEITEAQVELVALRKQLLRKAMLLTRSQHDAEDLVQTTFERLYQMQVPTLSTEAVLRLSHTILKRLAIDRSRHTLRWQLSELPSEQLDIDSIQPYSDSTAPWQTISFEQLQAALQRCAATDRETFELHYAHGLRYSEIAAQLGIAMGTVATRLHRARAQLRVDLDRLQSD